VPDGDLFGADEHVFDEEPQDTLAVGGLRAFGVVAELGEEAFEVIGELEVGISVGDLSVQSGELAAQVVLAGAQIGYPGAEFIEGDELFLERLDHAGDRCGGLGQGQFEPEVEARGLVEDAGLAEGSLTCIGRVAEHAPDHTAVPARLAGAGGSIAAGEPAGQVRDGGSVVGVAAKQLDHQRRLGLDDLLSGPALRGFAQVAVAERGAAQHIHRPRACPVGLPAPIALHQLGFHTRRTSPGTGPSADPRDCRRAGPVRTPPGCRRGRTPRSAAPGRRTYGRGGRVRSTAPRPRRPGR